MYHEHFQFEELQDISGVPSAPALTREDYDRAVQNLEQPEVESQPREFKVRAPCVFNSLDSFHCIGQFPFDAMHDFLEKVASADALSVLFGLSQQGYFTLDQYNAALMDLRLEGYENADRPPLVKVKSEKLPGTALEVALHVRVMPLLLFRLGITESEDNVLLDLLFMLHKMNEFIQADSLSKADPGKFEDLMVDFFEKRQTCAEECTSFKKIVPKFHFMEHYGDQMRNFGPMNGYWTARLEGKHRTYVNFSESAKNFINLTKTLARKNQNQLLSR